MKTSTGLTIPAILLVCTAGLHAASTIQFTTASYAVAEDAGAVTLTVQRLDDTNTVVSVDYASTNGTATVGLKYTTVSGTLTFAAGETNQAIMVPILNEGFVEGTQTFQVILSNPTGGAALGVRTNATVRITDNDKGLAFEFANYWAREDEGSVLIAVVRGDDGDFPVTVDYATTNGTATAGQDYTETQGTLTFAAGEKVKLFTVPILNDSLKEPNKIFRLTLSNPTGGAVLGSPLATTVTIMDNDPGVQFTQSQLWVHENEGAVVLTVTRGNDQLLDAFTVDYATTDGTATAGSNYTEMRGTLAFATGEMTQSFTVPILDDGLATRDKVFRVQLSDPTGGMALGAAVTATVTVCDTTEMRPHRFDAVQVEPDGTVSLTLGGGYTPGVALVNRFQPYFDIYPVEVSTNLVEWAPLTWLVRTNAATNSWVIRDPEAGRMGQRFYRTPATNFVAPQRSPSGPYPVGVIDRTIHDDSRRNRYRISTNGSFPITIWYPAQRTAGRWPARYEEEPIARDNRYGAWQGLVDQGPYFRSHSMSNAPFATALAGLPVVFWSHGWLDYRNDGQEWAEQLASHGYVVVAVDHFDGGLVVYPDGTYIYRDGSTDTTGRELSAWLVQDRVRDFEVVLDELARWNQNDPLFTGRLDVNRVASMGWSLGGATAGEFCRANERCRAAVAFDPGGYQPPLTTLGLQKPSLTMHNANASDFTLFSKATTNAVWFQIRYTEHLSFGTWYWTVASATPNQRRETARTITDYMLSFLNKYLKGSADPMPQPANYPQIFNYKQK